MLFLLLGWGEAIKNRKREAPLTAGAASAHRQPRHPFRRVLY